MHELALCLNIIRTLEKCAADEQKVRPSFQRIKAISLEIGELAGVELDALRFSFPIAAAHSIAEHAQLEIITIQGQAWCEDCQNHVSIKALFEACPCCGGYQYKITRGKELRIANMEVE